MTQIDDEVKAKVKDFEDTCNIIHPRLKELRDNVLRAIYQPAGANVIFVIGPTGAGKSHLNDQLLKYIGRLERERLENDPGVLDCRLIDVSPPLDGRFRWSDYFVRALASLEEPLIDKKIIYDYDFSLFLDKQNKKLAPLQQATENALFYRKLRAFCIDEAQHLVDLTNSETVIRQLNIIKSIADRSKVVHVLSGTYSLGNALQLNGQLVKRCRIFEFRAYDPLVKKDSADFKKALEKFQQIMPIPIDFQLADKIDFCIERSAGCIGIMRDWLVKSLYLAVEFNAYTLKLKHLEAAAFSKSQVNILFAEIKEGREKLAALLDEEEYRQQILRELAAERDKRVEKTGNKGNQKPGQRKSNRDDVIVTGEHEVGLSIDSSQQEKTA